MKVVVSAVLSVFIAASAYALPRDAAQKNEFRKHNPCPSTGLTTGACPGYQIDHKQALMNRGSDKPSNMQWLGTQEHTEKTKQDIALCRQSYGCKSKTLKKKLPWESKPKAATRGCHRVGGHNARGKGSHYVCEHT